MSKYKVEESTYGGYKITDENGKVEFDNMSRENAYILAYNLNNPDMYAKYGTKKKEG